MKHKEKILRKLSGIDDLLWTSLFRLIIGIAFLAYGFLTLWLVQDFWFKISTMLAFCALGLMFILDGQSILREYFINKQRAQIENKEINSLLIIFAKLFFIIGSALFFTKFYTIENPSLYPLVIFLISLFLIIIFYKKISHFELSSKGVIVKMARDIDVSYQKMEPSKKEWNYFEKGENKK